MKENVSRTTCIHLSSFLNGLSNLMWKHHFSPKKLSMKAIVKCFVFSIFPSSSTIQKACSKAVVPVLFLFCVALYYGALHVLKSSRALCPGVAPFVLAVLSPRLGKRELVYVLLVHLFVLYVLVFVIFLFLLVSGVGCGLWLCDSQDVSYTFWHTKIDSEMLINPLCNLPFAKLSPFKLK